jgi:hypothetical protein
MILGFWCMTLRLYTLRELLASKLRVRTTFEVKVFARKNFNLETLFFHFQLPSRQLNWRILFLIPNGNNAN